MKNVNVEDFIRYAKKQFDCDLVLNASNDPDFFQKIFGISFLEQDNDIEIENGFYDNSFMDIHFSIDNIVDFSCLVDLDLDLAA